MFSFSAMQPGERQQRLRTLERSLADRGEIEGGVQMRLGLVESTRDGCDFAQAAMRGQAHEWLVRCCGEFKRHGSQRQGTSGVAGRAMPARPNEVPVRHTERAFAPGEPAIVRL